MTKQFLLFGGFLMSFFQQHSHAESSHLSQSMIYSRISTEEIAIYRNQKDIGVKAFLEKYKDQFMGQESTMYEAALDQICQQKDCIASKLYWYTDIEQAKQVAEQENKPILSLRLLGSLATDVSCANSRFFRTTLYSNAAISQFLRDHFILHWQSVRPVPIVTIDFGEGRVLKRTITGNSIHYVLDKKGQILDALPGLYGPVDFLQQLQQANELAKEIHQLEKKNLSLGKKNRLAAYYQLRMKTIEKKWHNDLQTLQVKEPQGLQPVFTKEPSAEDAARRAISKMRVENPILRELRTSAANQMLLEKAIDEETWKKIAHLHRQEATLDKNSLALIQKKAETKEQTKLSSFAKKIDLLEESISIDTVRNTYLFQPKIYSWLLVDSFQALEQLNERVYRELFLTPSSDPWLGLKSEAYSGLDADGVI